jgi:beta-galactosidase GanA
MTMVATEEGDNLYGINNQYTHEDLGYIVAAHNPMMTTSANGYTYPNKTLDAKVALRDYLTKQYGTIAALNTAWHTNYTTWSTSDESAGEKIPHRAAG